MRYSISKSVGEIAHVICRECTSDYYFPIDILKGKTDQAIMYYANNMIRHFDQCHSGNHYREWCATCLEEAQPNDWPNKLVD